MPLRCGYLLAQARKLGISQFFSNEEIGARLGVAKGFTTQTAEKRAEAEREVTRRLGGTPRKEAVCV